MRASSMPLRLRNRVALGSSIHYVHPTCPTPLLQEEVDIAVRHALQEAARRSEGSFRGRSDVAGAAATAAEQDSSVHSANDSVRDGMTFRQVRLSTGLSQLPPCSHAFQVPCTWSCC